MDALLHPLLTVDSRGGGAMPEQISRDPEVTLKVLKEAGAACGQGAPQKILTRCPAERFCALPTGEICVYGVNEIPRMTQLTTRDLAPIVCGRSQASCPTAAGVTGVDGVWLGAMLLAALTLGRAGLALRRRWRGDPPREPAPSG
jgi:hypothetical protein